LCAWLIVSVAYTKRRNILKNEMWQLLLVTGIGILWDVFTGWHAWSVNFLFPFGALAVLCSIPVILVWAGCVTIPVPSVICAGISFLVLAGLFIFQKKDTLREFRKKLRM
ncbi:MAG TPA: alcohol acetyltransferase, partial [Candidatus Choladousia intestinipullorum]|nr:alcohol acetyltransferase [Candidatus Choladousia intestinipullorum]